jgi:hypothetical protein
MGGLAAQNVGIGTNNPTERLHVAGKLRLDNAFMPGGQAGAVGNILLSQGANAAPVWLLNGNEGTLLMSMGPGNNPVWATTFCDSRAQNRFIRFTSTSPTQVCNTTLAENNGNIWNADATNAPPYGVDKFAITATSAMPYAINGYATSGYGVYGEATTGVGVRGRATGADGRGVVGIATQATGRGVRGENTNADGIAGYFLNSAEAGEGGGDAVFGLTSQARGFGVWGVNNNTQAGTNPVGVVGSGGTGTAVYVIGGGGGSFTGRATGVAGFKIGALTDDQGGGYFTGDATGDPLTITHYAYVAYRTGGTNYKITGTGQVSTIVDGLNGRQDREHKL